MAGSSLERLNLAAVKRGIYAKDYHRFFLKAWKISEPHTPYIPNWHVPYLCSVLQAEVERIAAGRKKKQDLIINIPPRSSKSWVVTMALNAWAWINYPWLKFVTSSYNANLATDHSRRTRAIIESPWFVNNWIGKFNIVHDVNRLNEFENDRGGFRKAVGTGAGITGKGGDIIIADDPLDPQAAYSEAERNQVNQWWDTTMYSRLNDQETGLRIIVCQRLHHDDLVGHVLRKMPGRYRVIRIPGEIKTQGFSVAPRELAKNYEKGLFFPKRFSIPVLADMKVSYGGTGYANQIGQEGSQDSGSIFKRAWFQRRWKVLPAKMHQVIFSWDMAFKDKKDSSYVVGQVWGRVGALYFLMHQVREKLDFPATIAAFRGLCIKFPEAIAKIVEDKANGPAVVAMLKSSIPGIIAAPKTASKEEASHAAAPIWEAGNVVLPSDGSWVEEFIDEHIRFPQAKYNDSVDAANQALLYFHGKKTQGIEGMSSL